jgi:hypothetical protein
MIGGAAYSLMKYTSVNTLLDVELKAVTRKRAAVSSVRCAAAAAAVDTDMHVDNDSAEGTHSAEERRCSPRAFRAWPLALALAVRPAGLA